MICYTRGFEDVILQRVFSDILTGCYVDVGASTPVNDSNTYALYQKGWRGVAIEPLPYENFWRDARPDDRFLNLTAGAETGRTTLHIYDIAQQISTCSLNTVKHWQTGNNIPSRSIEVPIVTLNEVIDTYLPDRDLHLISIDVEGQEFEVLRGLDLQKHRPWIVVVEATLPGCPIESHQTWEPYITTADYSPAYFDGANRFYLANERHELLDRFRLPPNVWDNFQMWKQLEVEEENVRLKSSIAVLQKELLAIQASVGNSLEHK